MHIEGVWEQEQEQIIQMDRDHNYTEQVRE